MLAVMYVCVLTLHLTTTLGRKSYLKPPLRAVFCKYHLPFSQLPLCLVSKTYKDPIKLNTKQTIQLKNGQRT